jgi:hypothetical protein
MAGGIMSEDPDVSGEPLSTEGRYLLNYTTNTLHINPDRKGVGVYATLLADNEHLVGEIDVTSRSKIAVTGFYINEKSDLGTFKIIKINFYKRHDWREDGNI